MPYTPVPLFTTNDVTDKDRLNSIISNQNLLNESKVSIKYDAYGVERTEGIKIACGVTTADSPNMLYRNRWISAGSFFTPGTRPVGVASFASTRHRRATATIAQRTGQSHILDHTGMQVYVQTIVTNAAVLPFGPNYINWIMIGY